MRQKIEIRNEMFGMTKLDNIRDDRNGGMGDARSEKRLTSHVDLTTKMALELYVCRYMVSLE